MYVYIYVSLHSDTGVNRKDFNMTEIPDQSNTHSLLAKKTKKKSKRKRKRRKRGGCESPLLPLPVL